MPPPNRHRRPPPTPPAPLEPLGEIVREYETWRRAQTGKPSKGALREYWRQRDAKQGQRPDYLLWRQTQCVESPPEKRQDPVELALRAVRAQEAVVSWAGLALAPLLLGTSAGPSNPARRAELAKAVSARLGDAQRPLTPLPASPWSCALVAWIGRGMVGEMPSMLTELRELFVAIRADWKPGRSADLTFLKTEAWLPVSQRQVVNWLAAGIERILSLELDATKPNKMNGQDVVAWHLTAWMLLRDVRAPSSAARAEELEILLDAAGTARLGGDGYEAARLTALALNLATPQLPESVLQRCRVAAWTLAEVGLAAPAGLRVRLEDLPFPGEPPGSEKGMEAARLFHDGADVSRQALAKEILEDADWQKLRAAGVMLHHPLAALAWIGKRAQSYVVKKQQDLLQSAATLAARHQSLSTTGRILAQWPGSVDAVLNYAQAMRQSLRRMPVLRDSEVWQDWAADLRSAWGKLDGDAIHDPEVLFMLHETLLDREVTTLRCLPEELRELALRHFHSRRNPSALVQALEAEPKLTQSLMHQRTLELWALASDMRERPEQARTAWISLVGRGDVASGKYSLLVHGSGGRLLSQGRLKVAGGGILAAGGMDMAPLVKEIAEAVSKVGVEAEWLLMAVDPLWADVFWPGLLRSAGGLTANVAMIPSWEWAFRVMREAAVAGEAPFEVLAPEKREPVAVSGALPGACLLLGGEEICDAETRWVVANAEVAPGERPQTQRSLGIGSHALVLSEGPLKRGALKEDLVRLSLAASTRCLVTPIEVLTAEERVELQAELIEADPKVSLAERLRQLISKRPGTWSVNGLPWLNVRAVASKE